MTEPVEIDPAPKYRKILELGGGKLVSLLLGCDGWKIGSYNGVSVRNRRLFDCHDHFPEYEGPLIRAIRSEVQPSDTVVLIGGGLGVSSVACAKRVGAGGEVHTYEAVSHRHQLIKQTLELNSSPDCVAVHHAVVGAAIQTSGEIQGATNISANELPECDVLISDCEGAEKQILKKFDGEPRAIIVETHGVFDSPTVEVVSQLNSLGYEEKRREPESESDDVMVVTAVA